MVDKVEGSISKAVESTFRIESESNYFLDLSWGKANVNTCQFRFTKFSPNHIICKQVTLSDSQPEVEYVVMPLEYTIQT